MGLVDGSDFSDCTDSPDCSDGTGIVDGRDFSDCTDSPDGSDGMGLVDGRDFSDCTDIADLVDTTDWVDFTDFADWTDLTDCSDLMDLRDRSLETLSVSESSRDGGSGVDCCFIIWLFLGRRWMSAEPTKRNVTQQLQLSKMSIIKNKKHVLIK